MEIGSFLDYLVHIRRYSPRTVAAYEKDLDQFSEFCEKVEMIHDWREVKSGMIRRFEVGLMSGNRPGEERIRPMSATTVRRKISSIRTLFRFLEREGMVEDDPTDAVVLPKIPKRLPVFVPEYEMDQLLSVEEGAEEEFGDCRDLMLLLTAYCTGMRRSELVGLKLEDIDLGRGVIRITGKGGKQRILPVLDELADGIRHYLRQREGLVKGRHTSFFITDKGDPANEKFIYRHVKSCLSRVSTLSKRSPHVLRHTFATSLLNNGACIEAIRELLGHSNLAATQVYTHNSFESLKRVYNQAHPRA